MIFRKINKLFRKIDYKIESGFKPIKIWYIKSKIKDLKDIEDINQRLEDLREIKLSKSDSDTLIRYELSKVTNNNVKIKGIKNKLGIIKNNLKGLFKNVEFTPEKLFNKQ